MLKTRTRQIMNDSSKMRAKWLILISILAGNLEDGFGEVTSVTRHYQGDIYTLSGELSNKILSSVVFKLSLIYLIMHHNYIML